MKPMRKKLRKITQISNIIAKCKTDMSHTFRRGGGPIEKGNALLVVYLSLAFRY